MMSRTPRAEQNARRLAISSLLPLNPAAELPPSCPPPPGICPAGNDNNEERR